MNTPDEMTIRDLEIKLCGVFMRLEKDPKTVIQAKELANVAGKLIKAQSESMDYANMHSKKQVLPFMERSE